MRIGKCPDCGRFKPLTKHSKTGNHQPPFIRICRSCHDKRHGFGKGKYKYNQKYQKGTPKCKRK